MSLSKGAVAYAMQLAKLQSNDTELTPSDILILELITVLHDQKQRIDELQSDLDTFSSDLIDLTDIVTSM